MLTNRGKHKAIALQKCIAKGFICFSLLPFANYDVLATRAAYFSLILTTIS